MTKDTIGGLVGLVCGILTALLCAALLFLLEKLPGQRIARWLSNDLGLLGDVLMVVGIALFCIALPGLLWYGLYTFASGLIDKAGANSGSPGNGA